MDQQLKILDKRLQKLTHDIGRVADRSSVKAFIIGGVVRDLILRKKTIDLDIVIEGDAIHFGKILVKSLKARMTVYKQFLTATLILPNGLKFDLASTRKEVYPHPGALPVVEPSLLDQDLFRRDFTINALAFSINQPTWGRIVDLYGGLNDLREKKIRILHDKSFIDDPTRILRAVRFEQRFGFQLEKSTLQLLNSAIKNKVYDQVKPARYFAEFQKILEERFPRRYLKRLAALGGLRFLSKDIRFKEKGFIEAEKQILWFGQSTVDSKTLHVWMIYLMVLLKRIPHSNLKVSMSRFQLSNELKARIFEMMKAEHYLKCFKKGLKEPYNFHLLLKGSSLEMILFLMSETSSQKIRQQLRDYLIQYRAVRLLINGDDLKALGFNPGSGLGQALNEVLRLKMNGAIKTRKQELDAARKILKRNEGQHGAN